MRLRVTTLLLFVPLVSLWLVPWPWQWLWLIPSLGLPWLLRWLPGDLAQRFPAWIRWLPEDLVYIGNVLYMNLGHIGSYTSFVDLFEARARANPDGLMVVDTISGLQVSLGEMDRSCCRVARALGAALHGSVGLKEGDVASLFFLGSQGISSLSLWFGLSKLGCQVAWINPHLRGASLLHAVLSARSCILVADPELQEVVEPIFPKLMAQGIRCFYLSSTSPTRGVEPLKDRIEAASSDPVSPQIRAGVTSKSPALFIYTSGTTGLPKPVILTHKRILMIATTMGVCGVRQNDIIYTALPLYHTSALLLGIMGSIQQGCTCVLAPKFSASRFWDDCRKYQVTVIQYVGEVLRYLCNTPELLNPFELIQFDTETEKPIRDEKGRCIPVRPGETGLLVSRVTSFSPFLGYLGSREDTEKKLLRDVVRPGDIYFNSGDLMSRDSDGFLYFQDRIGDTFRWKGENVSTREVEGVLASVDFLEEVNVYGVPVPGCEGKVGMAAVQLRTGKEFDGQKLHEFIEKALPAYAAPHFIRIQDSLESTGSFKLTKSRLVREGFDLSATLDPLYVLDRKSRIFQPLTPDLHRAILDGSFQL
ncbi:bile acyl-CoA synthetase isoform X2 [Dromiciops gliroides]|uniref:bile acyl-CoA synthetase isoform X2 n=1 Tax=Dromiciops gliroides TaxID=33562 RepID=UPI001CC54423|nr:bile acyl-CoA synthetase isoform X2 [Dromiciops gliroides]